MVKVYRAGSFIKFIKNLYTVEVSTNFRIIHCKNKIENYINTI